MHYYLAETALDGSVYSCDKVCIMGKIGYQFLDLFSKELPFFLISEEAKEGSLDCNLPFGYKGLKKYSFYERMGIRFFRNNFELLLTDDSSFYFAYKHNTSIGKENEVSWKIELNPNKCMPCEFVDNFICFLIARSKPISVRITQLDVAIDLRTERINVYLDKDHRILTRIDSGDDNITEYLSKHNEHGFVKLYNKTKESKLDYTLTRLEITLKYFSFNDFNKVFPKVHVYTDKQITFEDKISELSHNDEIFVALLRLHPEYFNKLTDRKKQKLRPYLCDSAPLLKPDINAFVNLIEKVREAFYVPK